MKIKLFFLLISVLVLSGLSQAQAEVIHLDGIANAGWYADDLIKAHLYIADPAAPGMYYYQWSYSPANPAPLWNSRQALASDLSDGVLNNGTVVGNWQIESGGDVFNNPGSAIWKKIHLTSGTYQLKLTTDSRAYQLNDFLWTEPGSSLPVWNAYVQMYVEYDDATSESFNFGDWSRARGSEGDVLALYHSSLDGMILNLTKLGSMCFYLNDYNSVDNGGSVTLQFDRVSPVPVPDGLLLLGSGLTAVLVRRRHAA